MDEVSRTQVVQMLEVAPCFPVADVVAAAEHYRDTLGFTFDPFDGDPPTTMVVSRDGIAIVLRQADSRARRDPAAAGHAGADAYVWVTDVGTLAEELRERGAELLADLAVPPVAEGREVRVRDLDGRVICFGELRD